MKNLHDRWKIEKEVKQWMKSWKFRLHNEWKVGSSGCTMDEKLRNSCCKMGVKAQIYVTIAVVDPYFTDWKLCL